MHLKGESLGLEEMFPIFVQGESAPITVLVIGLVPGFPVHLVN